MAGRLTRLIASGALLDVTTVVVVLLLSAGSALTTEDVPTWLALAGAGVSGVSLAWRRSFPQPVLLVCLLCYGLTGIFLPTMLALGTVAADYGPVRRTWTWATWSAAVVVAVSLLAGDEQLLTGGNVVRALSDIALYVAFPVAVGLFIESRGALLGAAQARAAELEASAELRAEQARQEERARIAGEMHDVVAHRVSLIALQAGALEMTCEGRPEAESARLIRTTARQALEELRGVVGVLRDPKDTAERVPTPGLADVATLVRDWQAAGAPVALSEELSTLRTDALSIVAGRAVYRVVQEALTNASKHAPGARVRVRVTAADGALSVVVENGPATRVSSRAGTGSGHGLIGLQERVHLAGGAFEAEPQPDGGFAVRASVPVAGDGTDVVALEAPVEADGTGRRSRDQSPFFRGRAARGRR